MYLQVMKFDRHEKKSMMTTIRLIKISACEVELHHIMIFFVVRSKDVRYA